MDSYSVGCKEIDGLFMKHLDGMITAAERDEVMAHLDECAPCREDFEVYETIRAALGENTPVCSAPEGFEEAIMQRIAELPSRAEPFKNASFVLFGALAASAGALGTFFFEDIAEALSRNIVLPDFLPAFEAFFESFMAPLAGFTAALGDTVLSLFEMLAQLQLALLIIFVLLIMLQFVVYKFDKA